MSDLGIGVDRSAVDLGAVCEVGQGCLAEVFNLLPLPLSGVAVSGCESVLQLGVDVGFCSTKAESVR